MFAALVEGGLVTKDDSWTMTHVLSTEQFVKTVLGWSGQSAADPPQ